jgi:retron-type reverse transcriptase
VRVREIGTLLPAWEAIRRNGETSKSQKTREETRKFQADLPRKLRAIQERLRNPPYKFARQIGATPEKAKGKGKRPLVIAPIPDRIVQRAILDVLQDAEELTAVQQVLATPTSIGGIRGRGVEDAIAIIEQAYSEGNAIHVAGSDISGFFTRINQTGVVQFIKEQTDDEEFVELFASALRVDLANADDMTPEERDLFPRDGTGVAQGCPLSAFAGNVALREFDERMNGRGIICVRYIDDFILLCKHQKVVLKAFENAGEYLKKLNMSIYKPEDRPDKAFAGPIGGQFEFLGYQLIPGTYPPTEKNQKSIIEAVHKEFEHGRAQILRSFDAKQQGKPLQVYAQTLVSVDALLRAWSGSFRASRCVTTAKRIDEAINGLISDFIAFYRDRTSDRDITSKRRALGVHVLADEIYRRTKA